MSYLLDTHTLIWSLIQPGKLPAGVKKVIANPSNNIYVSAVSFWEISLKYSLNKLELNGVLPNQFPSLSLQTGFKNIPIVAEDCAEYHLLKKTEHKDPFDRMLVWQAIKQKLIFVSKDNRLLLYKDDGLQLFWDD